MRIKRQRQITFMVSEVELAKITTLSEAMFGNYGMQKYLRRVVLPQMERDWVVTGGGRLIEDSKKEMVNVD